jgi:serine/threonine protein phosphatase 1
MRSARDEYEKVLFTESTFQLVLIIIPFITLVFEFIVAAHRMSPFQSSLLQKKQKPRVPDGVRIYAIGDIHGRADLLVEVFKRIDADLAKNPTAHCIEVFLGDYVDRGPASRQVLDQLVLRSGTRRTIFLKGNHEVYMARFLSNPTILENWQGLGGFQTLMSYGIKPSIDADPAAQVRLAAAFGEALPESHRKFLANLKLSLTCGDFLFVHAGIRPGVPLAQQREEDLLWIRQDFLICEDDFGKIVVHGHTPVSQPEIRLNRINIDTGAYATGQLTCLMLEGNNIRII